MKAEPNAPVTVKDVQAYGILLAPHLGHGVDGVSCRATLMPLPLGSGRD